MKFLEINTDLDNDALGVLVPIDRIKYIYSEFNQEWKIHIEHEDNTYSWIECFENEKGMRKRYEFIKELLNQA